MHETTWINWPALEAAFTDDDYLEEEDRAEYGTRYPRLGTGPEEYEYSKGEYSK